MIAALVLWWFGRDLNWGEVRVALARSDWRLIAAAVAVVSTTYLVRAYRWRALLAPLAHGVSLRELFAATTVGFGSVFLVGRAGEVVRPAFLPLREPKVRPGASFVTIAVERIYDMAAIVILFAANLVVFRAPGGDPSAYARVRTGGLVLLIAAAAGIGALVWFRRRAESVLGWLDERLARLPKFLQRAGQIVTGLLGELAGALRVLVDARELLLTIGWTALLWASIALANWLVYRAFGLPLGLSATVFVLGWSLVGSLVPTPGGAAGTFHLATAFGLMFLGVNENEAKAAAIVLHLVFFGPALFLGLYYFLRSDVSLARLRRLAGEETRADGEKEAERHRTGVENAEALAVDVRA